MKITFKHPQTRARRREVNTYYNKRRDGFGNIINDKDPLAPKQTTTLYCPSCKKEKMCFETEAKANRFIEYNSERIALQKGYAPIRAYYCSYCGGWHVTSKDKKTKYVG